MELYEKNVSGLTREIGMLMENIGEQQSYLEQSLIMNMSPYDMWKSRIVLFVKTDYQILPVITNL